MIHISESHIPESKPAQEAAGIPRNKNGRYFHGIVTFVTQPEHRHYFILDSHVGMLSIFNSLSQLKSTQQIVICRCLMSPQSIYGNVNPDLDKKFEVQPMTRKQTAHGDLLQIAVPNESSQDQFMLLVEAFMAASRLPYPPREAYFASNVVNCAGKGCYSLGYGIARGVAGIVYDPYIGGKTGGVKGGLKGVAKGFGGLVARPVKGGFDFIAQPIAGAIKTPKYLYKKIKKKKDKTRAEETNFKMFGIEENSKEGSIYREYEKSLTLSAERLKEKQMNEPALAPIDAISDPEDFNESDFYDFEDVEEVKVGTLNRQEDLESYIP